MIELKFEVDKLEEYKEQILNSKKDKKVVKHLMFENGDSYIVVPSYDALKFSGGITLFYSYLFGWNLFRRGKNIARSKDWISFKISVLESDI